MSVSECDTSMKHTVFEDNSDTIELKNMPKMRLRIKHMVIKHYNFRSLVAKVNKNTVKVDTTGQEVDFLTKPLAY